MSSGAGEKPSLPPPPPVLKPASASSCTRSSSAPCELQSRILTDFGVAAVQDAAQRAIEQAGVVRLSLAEQECFAQALLSPPEPVPALKRAFEHRRRLLRDAR